MSKAIESQRHALTVHLKWLRDDLGRYRLNEHSQERIAWYLGKALAIVKDAIDEAKNGTRIEAGDSQ